MNKKIKGFSISLIILFDIGFVKDANVSIISFINKYFENSFGTALFPNYFLPIYRFDDIFPFTSIISDNGKLILKLNSQKSFTSLFSCFS